MAFDFDTPIPIQGHGNAKWDAMEAVGTTADDAIAMWVADMDFPAAPCIRDALRADVERGFMGYPANAPAVKKSVSRWMEDRHNWPVDPDWIRFTHGVIAGLAMVLDAFSDPGDGVILFTPVYHSFFGKIRAMDRRAVESPMPLRDGVYHMDLDALESSLDGSEKVVILCSPHNPGGRLWSKGEIAALAAFCDRHELILVSDEIHMDLTFPGARHLPTAIAAPDILPRLVVLTAASKSFNIAGGETGFAIVPDDALRARFDKSFAVIGGTPNRFGIRMIGAAYDDGAEWMDAVRGYIADNFAIWADRIGALPGVRVMPMQSTYLAWVDFTDTGLSADELTQRIARDARIAANPGPQFGTGGDLHARFNLAMPRALMMQAIERMEAAFADLQ